MKILAYSHRKDETEYFKKFSSKYNVEIILSDSAPDMDTAELSRGIDYISIITTPVNEELLKKFKDCGVKFISTRTIGYDHIDLDSAEKLGIHVGNATYSPNSVADYAIMMMLMAVRKMKLIMDRSSSQDFSLGMVQGRELPNLTVGVIGTGRIGETVIKHLSGFGCRIIAHDIYEKESVKKYAEYRDLDYVLQNSHIITLHMPATEDNYHLINKKTISEMKDNVFIINTGRGSLINTDDFIEGIESGKIAGAALDVIENETGLYYNDLKGQVLNNRQLAVLKSFPNVIVTPHTAFYTDQAVSDMVENSIKSIILFDEKKENPWQVL
ncbi:D-isomer specific 2-hydroxyacid dehydrogenase family protein [uncultured Clostridium sp.]|uniref:D-isomer specific 2-hydroxyacid dehydrogenase family protein n=1 Tax=uncultured Clostridium sp. TaxID=59620 RepID=UPI0025DCF94B|nr:D-isomer specific 2-hydroxyacid dehydrogenase family protein [uncultured Clostridium sp.]